MSKSPRKPRTVEQWQRVASKNEARKQAVKPRIPAPERTAEEITGFLDVLDQEIEAIIRSRLEEIEDKDLN